MSNFDIDELAELLGMARIKPALVQRHSDPLSADAATQALCRLAGVQYQVPPAKTCCTGMHCELTGGMGDLFQCGRRGRGSKRRLWCPVWEKTFKSLSVSFSDLVCKCVHPLRSHG